MATTQRAVVDDADVERPAVRPLRCRSGSCPEVGTGCTDASPVQRGGVDFGYAILDREHAAAWDSLGAGDLAVPGAQRSNVCDLSRQRRA